jgi:hypothetical protein
VVDVQEKAPAVLVMATLANVSVPRVPVTDTVWPIYNPGVAVQENCPAVPVTATDARMSAASTFETTVVLAGIPVPVTV